MRAFVVGNAALDETLAVEDFPSPGASIFGEALSQDLGGKGLNQAVAICRTGLDCVFIAAVGDDARGREIASRLSAEPLEARLVELPGIPTDISVILMAQFGENAVITTRAAAAALTAEDAIQALAAARPSDLVVMQGNLGETTTRDMLRHARERGLRTAMNPSPMQPFARSLLDLVDSVFVNEGEAEMLGGVDTVLAAGASEVVLTLGSRGAALIRSSGRVDVAAHPCTVVDTTGAGDCFMGVALASAALRGVTLDTLALRHGARAAAYTVARAGTVKAFPDCAVMRDILGST